MADELFYHEPSEEAPAPPLPDTSQMMKINLFDRLAEAQATTTHPSTKSGQPATIAATSPSEAPPEASEEAVVAADPAAATPASGARRLVLGLLAAVLLIGLGTGGYLAYHSQRKAPVAVTTPESKASPTPTLRPSRRPSPSPFSRPSPKPSAPAPQPPAPASKTYTVQNGDTLITIGDKLHKDWHAIAAANNNIHDPNFISPGQVLKIP